MDERLITLKPDWMWTPEGLRENWSISIQSGVIVDVGPAERHSEITEKLSSTLLVPGFVNAHSHAFQRAFRGHVQWKNRGDDDFWSWREAMYGVANRLSPEGVFAVSRLAFMEMVESGITHVGEFHYLHHNPDGTRYADPNELAHRVIEAALDVGLKISLLRVAYARSGFERPMDPLQRRFIDLDPDHVLASVQALEQYGDPRVSVGLAPHSIRAVDGAWLEAFANFKGPIHMHVSEQPGENAASQNEYGMSPLAIIQQKGLLSDRFTAVHMTHPVAGDLQRMQEAKARICVCPTTELDLGDGFLPNAYRVGVSLCIGSDSQTTIDMMAESRALEMHGRGVAGRRNVLAPVGEPHGLADRLLRAATYGGQEALGRKAEGIKIGQSADLTAVRLDNPTALGMPPLEALVFSSRPEWVSDVWVQGRRVVQHGVHPNRAKIMTDAAKWIS